MSPGGRARSGAAAGLLAAASCIALLLLWVQATRSEDASFFAHEAPAEWIVYPQAPSLGARGRIELTATFSREFELPAKPDHARLRVRMHRSGTLALNGARVELGDADGAWKRARGGDVAALLHAGRNTIQARVAADAGPPALWLVLETGDAVVATDASWTASLMGAEDAPARLASVPMSAWSRTKRDPAVLDAENPRPFAALRARAPALAALVALGGALAGGVAYGLRGAKRLSARWAFGAWLVAALVWAALFWNNRSLHGAWGFDVGGHHDYIAEILWRGHLPLANEGFQMYQPPLYYVLAGGLLHVLGFGGVDQESVQWLRLLGLAAGWLQAAFVLLALRELLPERPGLVLAGFAFAVCLPAQLYLSHYVTNEIWVAALASGALWWTIRMLRRDSSRAWEHAVLGAFLGLALLTKFSALLPLALCTGLLFAQRWLAGRRSVAEHLRLFGATFAVVLALSGWHYARVAAEFGNPFIGNWDAATGYVWWQDPGYHVLGDYLRFGLALERPLGSAIASVPDALYSTLWGDGLIGGSGFSHVTPPWRLDWMAAGYALALGPCLALGLGVALAFADYVRRPRTERLLAIAALGGTLFLLLTFTLRLPYYAQAKAFYGLSALVPLAFFFALGFDALALRRRALAPLGVAWLAGWALVSLVTFFAPAERLREDPMQLSIFLDPGGHVAEANEALARGDREAAIAALRAALALDPDHPRTGPALVKLLRDAGRPEEALAAVRAALRVDPYDAALHGAASALWRELGAPRRAVFHDEAARQLSRLRVRY
jgi:tetratricopeptide (TPR) repeat protein